MGFRFELPLPRIVLHPLTSLSLGAIHLYLAVGHLAALATRDVQWTHIWKGFGALAGAYVFTALASRGFVRYEDHRRPANPFASGLNARGKTVKKYETNSVCDIRDLCGARTNGERPRTGPTALME